MKRFTLFTLLLIVSHAGTAQIFNLYELDLYAKNSSIDPIRNGQYADINSTLYVQLDKVAIATAIREFTSGDTIAVERLRRLKLVLANQVEILKAFASYGADPTLNSLNNLADQMQSFFMAGEKYKDIQDLYDRFSLEYNQVYTRLQIRDAGKNGIPFRDEFIFIKMAEYAREIALDIQDAAAGSDIQFLLSGRISTPDGERDIKLSDDFDSFAAQRYVVPRWQTELTEEGKKELEEINQLAGQLNRLLEEKNGDIHNWLADSFQADDCLNNLETQLLALPQTLSTIAPQLARDAREIIEEPYQKAKLLSDAYTQNIAQADNRTSVQLLTGLNDDLHNTAQSIDILIGSLGNEFMSLLEDIPNNRDINALLESIDNCKAQLTADKNKILNVADRLSALFGQSKAAAETIEALSDEVRRLSYDAIPDESFIDLRNTGQRGNGDQIYIRAILEQPTENGEDPVFKIIDQRIFRVQQIGLHSVVKPMLLLANPVGNGENVDLSGKQFQFAPSYSLLLKFGSRKSKAWNEVWQPSLGVNFGALDFDTDAVPEFGAALEFTFLRDYFSAGYGYNFGADEPYFLIGFRLPVGAIPLPIFNDVQTSSP